MGIRHPQNRERHTTSAIRILRQRLSCLEASCIQNKIPLNIHWLMPTENMAESQKQNEKNFVIGFQAIQDECHLYIDLIRNAPTSAASYSSTFLLDTGSREAVNICFASINALIQKEQNETKQECCLHWGYSELQWNLESSITLQQFMRQVGETWSWNKQRRLYWKNFAEKLHSFTNCTYANIHSDGVYLAITLQLETKGEQNNHLSALLQSEGLEGSIGYQDGQEWQVTIYQSFGALWQNSKCPCEGRLSSPLVEKRLYLPVAG